MYSKQDVLYQMSWSLRFSLQCGARTTGNSRRLRSEKLLRLRRDRHMPNPAASKTAPLGSGTETNGDISKVVAAISLEMTAPCLLNALSISV